MEVLPGAQAANEARSVGHLGGDAAAGITVGLPPEGMLLKGERTELRVGEVPNPDVACHVPVVMVDVREDTGRRVLTAGIWFVHIRPVIPVSERTSPTGARVSSVGFRLRRWRCRRTTEDCWWIAQLRLQRW